MNWKHTILTTAAAVIMGGATGANAEPVTLRLPAKYVLTTTTYNRMTGITIDEKSKDKLKMVPLAVQKTTVDGTAFIEFTKKALQGESKETDTATGTLPYADKADLLQKLLAAKKKMENASMKRTTEVITVHKGDTLSMVADMNAGKAALTLLVGGETGSSFVLNAPQVGQLIDAIKRQ